MPASGAVEPNRRVLIVDDHPLSRMGLAMLLADEPWVGAVQEVGRISEAMVAAKSAPIDAAVVDVILPDGHGSTLVEHLRRTNPQARVLVLTYSDAADDVVRCRAAGAHGYLIKSEPPARIVEALRLVADGAEVFGSEAVATSQRVAHTGRKPFDVLTPRDRQIVIMLADRRTDRQIGEVLGIAPKTVANRITLIQANLGVVDKLSLVLLAREHNIV